MTAETKKGKIAGVDMGDYIEYRGIPYARPPVGALRWKAPKETECWEGVYKADTFSPKAMQEDGRGDGLSMYIKEFYSNPAFARAIDEDCLYLNIWAPRDSIGKKLPTAFWIHGGAFLGGYSSEMEFDGAEYCRRGVILVSVGYRLNIFGFLAHPWLTEENPHGVSGNYGILDQVAALKWVYENIEAFGGDKDNITVFGQSAGAMSAQTLVSSRLTGHMISKAIFQSGGGYAGGLIRKGFTRKELEGYGEDFVRMTGAGSLEELREIPGERLNQLCGAFLEQTIPKSKGLFLMPVIDGYVLEQDYDELTDQGEIKDIPYMLGTTRDDILVTPELKERGKYSTLYHGCLAFCKKRKQQKGQPAYVYYFNRRLPGDEAGAFHSSELWYTFGTLGRCWRPMTEQDYKLSSQMLDYWCNFMKTGNPNGPGLSEWEPCSGQEAEIKIFDITDQTG